MDIWKNYGKGGSKIRDLEETSGGGFVSFGQFLPKGNKDTTHKLFSHPRASYFKCSYFCFLILIILVSFFSRVIKHIILNNIGKTPMGLYNTFGVTVTKRWPLKMARGVISKLKRNVSKHSYHLYIMTLSMRCHVPGPLYLPPKVRLLGKVGLENCSYKIGALLAWCYITGCHIR